MSDLSDPHLGQTAGEMAGRTTSSSWLAPERESLAVDRILDAAGVLFAERGVHRVGMNEVARAAGCSRATLYRYVPNREALRLAFVHREARRIGRAVHAETADVTDARQRLVLAVEAALRGVRSQPVLAVWFTEVNVGAASELAMRSEVIEAFVAAFLGDVADPEIRDRARWVVRVVLSLLTLPAPSPEDERAMIERYVVPVVIDGA